MNCVSRGGVYLVNSHCDVQEEDRQRRETYDADWLNLVMETRPQYKVSLLEKDTARRESYEQQQVVNFLVQRNLDQTLRLGKEGEAMTEHQLPSKPLFNVPVFKPGRAASPQDSQRTSSPSSSSETWGSIIADPENNGVCIGKQAVNDITKCLPKRTQPIRVNFRASSLVSSPMATYHWMLNRE